MHVKCLGTIQEAFIKERTYTYYPDIRMYVLHDATHGVRPHMLFTNDDNQMIQLPYTHIYTKYQRKQ